MLEEDIKKMEKGPEDDLEAIKALTSRVRVLHSCWRLKLIEIDGDDEFLFVNLLWLDNCSCWGSAEKRSPVVSSEVVWRFAASIKCP